LFLLFHYSLVYVVWFILFVFHCMSSPCLFVCWWFFFVSLLFPLLGLVFVVSLLWAISPLSLFSVSCFYRFGLIGFSACFFEVSLLYLCFVPCCFLVVLVLVLFF
jgi:hypothetical protein